MPSIITQHRTFPAFVIVVELFFLRKRFVFVMRWLWHGTTFCLVQKSQHDEDDDNDNENVTFDSGRVVNYVISLELTKANNGCRVQVALSCSSARSRHWTGRIGSLSTMRSPRHFTTTKKWIEFYIREARKLDRRKVHLPSGKNWCFRQTTRRLQSSFFTWTLCRPFWKSIIIHNTPSRWRARLYIRRQRLARWVRRWHR